MPRGSSPNLTMRHPVPAIFFDRFRHLPTSFFCDSNGLQPSHPVKATYVSVPITGPHAPAELCIPRELCSPQGSATTAYGPPLLLVPFAPSVLYPSYSRRHTVRLSKASKRQPGVFAILSVAPRMKGLIS
jgi:hypothetical protein